MTQRTPYNSTPTVLRESRGNAFSGFVALALLAMFALALVSSELDSGQPGISTPVATVIAGQ